MNDKRFFFCFFFSTESFVYVSTDKFDESHKENLNMYIYVLGLFYTVNLRPEIFHRVKSGDQTKIGLPCFAFVIFEEPKCPSEKK